MAGNLGGLVKRLQDIMRQDAGINGDAQRIEQIVWMLFLKVYSAKEEEWEFADKAYISIIPEDYRWQVSLRPIPALPPICCSLTTQSRRKKRGSIVWICRRATSIFPRPSP